MGAGAWLRVLRALVFPHARWQRGVRQHVWRLQDGHVDRLGLVIGRGDETLPRDAAVRAAFRGRDRRLLVPQRWPARHAHGRSLHDLGPFLAVLRARQGASHPLRLRDAPWRVHRRQDAASPLERRREHTGPQAAQEHQDWHRRQGRSLFLGLGAGVLHHSGGALSEAARSGELRAHVDRQTAVAQPAGGPELLRAAMQAGRDVAG
mmetsp:Transcript_63623/g.176975  ORF Transcript_63623/g.176975 Transcript_63623/m.176975 type:complete len:206 (+) Transcript_63623:252-869(+)